ncbi:MAG: 4'-phosphopantetheinyl transferase superfamily protein [Candidatus Sabulitectum sp.]|nr:4'-phosphopantetheinyl transferase superfamily protein [Candidatus Sabulitectum sp.]
MKTGTDVVENARFIRAVNRNEGRLRERLFTREELACSPENMDLAVMFSAKESVAKALGTGFDSFLSWHDIKIFINGDDVTAVLSGRALELAEGYHILLSATQDRNTSVTCALLTEGE